MRSRTTAYYLEHPGEWLDALKTQSETYWMRRGERMALGLYRQMVRRVPAYGAFLAAKNFKSASVRSVRDFVTLPPVSKDGYLKKFSLSDVCWDGSLTQGQRIISATSGSTGEPFYFPRTHEQDLQYAAVAEMYLRSNFSVHKKSTLFIIGWGMGIWIGGVFSYAALRIVAERSRYRLSIMTPGSNTDEILQAVVRLGPLYDQVIIGGYPPMIKDLVDEGVRRDVLWKRYHVKFIFSAEGFSEEFRDYIAHHTGLSDILRDTLNHYGTVDLGTMAHETPVSVLIRRLAMRNPGLNDALFGHPHRQPTLAQYIPELFYFEESDGSVLCSGFGGIPLVRYDFIDTGGVMTFAGVKNVFSGFGIDLEEEIRKAGIAETVWQLPFVYVFERRDFTVKLSGANIFPQEIRRALEHPDVKTYVSGRCTMQVGLDRSMDQYLTVNIELNPEVRGSVALKKQLCRSIVSELRSRNSEYAYLYSLLPRRRLEPHIILWKYQEGEFFRRRGKQTWVSLKRQELVQ